MKKSPNGTFQPRNAIEHVIRFLPEVGDKLLKMADDIQTTKRTLIELNKMRSQYLKILREQKSAAKASITQHYTESEIDIADVLATNAAKAKGLL